MQLLDLTIGVRHFFLPASIDRAAFEQRLEDAARAGGAMVRIPTAHGEDVAALVGPGIPVFVEQITASEDVDQDEFVGVLGYDFDL